MKTATITWITYNNYGTELQAYSLQKYIQSMGIDNVIISDREIINEKRQNKSESISIISESKNAYNNYRSFGRIFRKFKYIFHPKRAVILIRTLIINKRIQANQRNYYASQRRIDEFKSTELVITDPVKRNQMTLLNDEYDVFIAGSDQIWSPLDVDFDGYYYLDFVNKKKGSYAPSLGTTNISPNKTRIIKNYLMNYDFCSVRENQSAVQFTDELEIKTEWVCDPTLLFDSSYWEDFSKGITTPQNEYLLCYFLGTDEWYFNYATKTAKELGLRLVIIPSRITFCSKKNIYPKPVGPKEFVALFCHASFILTDSYHGTIFSLIFQKQLLHLKRFNDNAENCQNIRVYSLLEYLNLSDIVLEQKEFEQSDLFSIDYNYVNCKINEFRNRSQRFLEDSLSDV